MKTIEVTNEQYEFLKEAKHLLNTQDNRSTLDPIYCIMEKKRTYGYDQDYASDFIWAWDDEEIADNTNNIFEEILNQTDEETILDLWKNVLNRDEISIDEIIEKLNKDLDDGDFDIEDWLSDKGLRKAYYKESHELSQHANIFSLFEIDAKEYAESKNSKLYFDYAESTWRSNRMSNLIKLLKEINL